jgi:hypothetical protein
MKGLLALAMAIGGITTKVLELPKVTDATNVPVVGQLKDEGDSALIPKIALLIS